MGHNEATAFSTPTATSHFDDGQIIRLFYTYVSGHEIKSELRFERIRYNSCGSQGRHDPTRTGTSRPITRHTA